MAYLKRIGVACFNFLLKMSLAIESDGINKELARRNAQRGGNSLRWLTPDEAAVTEALAGIIVPSDEETPGLEEVCVLDEPAIVRLDKLVEASSYRQQAYAYGLLAFDRWALSEHGRRFVELTKEDQTALFRTAQQMFEGWAGDVPAIRKAWRRLRAIMQTRKGLFFAGQLYPQIRSDCLQVFYTSRVSWVWLEYDGPPMEKGYPSVTTPREQG